MSRLWVCCTSNIEDGKVGPTHGTCRVLCQQYTAVVNRRPSHWTGDPLGPLQARGEIGVCLSVGVGCLWGIRSVLSTRSPHALSSSLRLADTGSSTDQHPEEMVWGILATMSLLVGSLCVTIHGRGLSGIQWPLAFLHGSKGRGCTSSEVSWLKPQERKGLGQAEKKRTTQYVDTVLCVAYLRVYNPLAIVGSADPGANCWRYVTVLLCCGPGSVTKRSTTTRHVRMWIQCSRM